MAYSENLSLRSFWAAGSLVHVLEIPNSKHQPPASGYPETISKYQMSDVPRTALPVVPHGLLSL
jgi:hypothetical protein